jgi:C-5 cytosine-specific DNA methylase
VLDAQFFGVPQQRRRLFVVAHFSGDCRYPGAVLFDRQAFDYNRSGGDPEKRSLPILTTTTAGNSNARGVVIFEEDSARTDQSGRNADKETGKQRVARRLTPEEEEKRQGFPGNHTLLPDMSKFSDSDRYKAIGNSMAIPVMRWIGERISFVEQLISGDKDMKIVNTKICEACGASYKRDAGNKHRDKICTGAEKAIPSVIIPTSPTPLNELLLGVLTGSQKDALLLFGKCEITTEQLLGQRLKNDPSH